MQTENIHITTPVYLFYKDLNSRFLSCNTHLACLAGLQSVNDIIGKSDYDFVWGDEYAKLYQDGDKQVLEGLAIENQIEPLLRADGKIITILINKIPLLNQASQKIGVMGSFIEKIDFESNDIIDPSKPGVRLTANQAEYLYHLANGMTVKQIANHMAISVRTAEYYTNTLKAKFNLHSKSALMAKALTLPFIRKKLLEHV